MYPGLGNVHGHGGHSGDEATDHTGSEVALDVVLKVVWGGREEREGGEREEEGRRGRGGEGGVERGGEREYVSGKVVSQDKEYSVQYTINIQLVL